jgi:adenylylsulfate kinase-like enzyme
LEVCEGRDTKGLYAKARAGEIKGFTGIDDPYEAPENAEVICHTADESVEESAQKVIDKLVELKYLEV